MRGLLAAVGALVAGLSVVPSPTAPAAALEADAPARPAVVEVRTIGHSVRGRPIRAWRLGEPGKRPMVLVSTMHGNEPHTRRILETLRDGRAIRGVDLWVVPTYNPDGLARGTRRNAHGVDLNRNFPYKWADLDGNYESGPRPGSEPETRAMMGFLQEVRPRRVLSFHQPLVGVDTKDAGFARRVARALRLPRKTLDCGGLCHGTMTMWFNHHFAGSALTVEYGARPPRRRMVVQAPRQVLGVLGAHRTSRG
jgi:protein MpaA